MEAPVQISRPESSAPPLTEGLAISACWNDIGVYGNGSCASLVQHVHCRNCPVYSEAAAHLLDRALPADYRQEWAQHFAEKRKPGPHNWLSLVLFRLAGEWLALPTYVFQEVAEKRLIHSLPHRRGSILSGLVNIRGELLLCVSVGRLLGLETAEGGSNGIYQRLLVASWQGQRLVFPVDEVPGVYRLLAESLKEPPATVTHSSSTYTRGVFQWQQKSVGLLDADLVFSALNRGIA